jgi:tryptophan-rich sensory protein
MIIRTVKLKKLLLYVVVTFLFGGIGALLGGGTSQIYTSLNKPFLSPPRIVFPIVWSILYLLMGIGAYFLSNERNSNVSKLLKVYWIQLVFNALWPFVFWKLQAFWLAAIIIAIILILVVWLTYNAYQINKLSALLFVPYIVWLLFALYLNIAIAFLN